MTKEALNPNVLKRAMRPLAVASMLGLAACSGVGETTVPETTSTTEASSTAEALGGLVASGTVRCPDGMSVVGVWVETAQADRGWADWSADLHDPQVADYSRTLGDSVGYGLNVGCGGTFEDWEQNIQVDSLVAGDPANLACEQTTLNTYTCQPLG